jgi:hypothetical protein
MAESKLQRKAAAFASQFLFDQNPYYTALYFWLLLDQPLKYLDIEWKKWLGFLMIIYVIFTVYESFFGRYMQQDIRNEAGNVNGRDK